MDQNRLKIKIDQGQTLWEALADKGIVLDRPCGGRGVCGGCAVVVEGIGRVNACRFAQEGIWQIALERSPVYTIVQPDVSKEGEADAADLKKAAITADNTTSWEPETGNPYIAVDIGTTTVALTGSYRGKFFQDGFVNPQRRYGADVVSRISAANAGHADEMRELLKARLMESLDFMMNHWRSECSDAENPDTGLDDSFGEDTKQTEIDSRDAWQSKLPCKVCIAGNTTMLHILRGFSCEGLGQAPFTPVSLEAGTEIWQGRKARYEVYYAPGISVYVGADIVSGIYALHMAESEEVSLLLDLGTNGEMALGNARHMLCASAAAGPAFEGGRLASLIHASGILSCLHEMLDQGIIDETGLLAEPYFEEGYPVPNEIKIVPEVKLAQEEICITQDDIREIQMAKGAISAGIHILLKEYGVSPEHVSHIYLAGGMGYYLNPEDAVAIGLLPEEFSGRIQAVGNSSLRGLLRLMEKTDDVKLFAESMEPAKDESPGFEEKFGDREEILTKIATHTKEIILAQHPDFEEAYISGMNFPGQR